MIFLAALALAAALFLRSPGLDVRDGRDDRGRNGIAVTSAWLTGTAPAGDFAAGVREQRMAEIMIELPPPNADGTLAGSDSARVDALLYECYDARGWVQIIKAPATVAGARPDNFPDNLVGRWVFSRAPPFGARVDPSPVWHRVIPCGSG